MNVFVRIWQQKDSKEIEKHLFVIGDLTGECFSCHTLGIGLTEKSCPACRAVFRYIGFRRKTDFATIKRFSHTYPDSLLIDFDDFKKNVHKDAARKLLDM